MSKIFTLGIKWVLCWAFIIPLALVHAQTPVVKDTTLKPIACDCKDAIVINLHNPLTVYGPTVDSKGYGEKQEIPIKEKFSKYYFEEEHNSAWYLLKIDFDGDLVFDIKPVKPTDDYDFILFQYTDSTFCEKFIRKKLIPVRSNISRNTDSTGYTGLSIKAQNDFAERGPGNSYSKSISVKKGEKYMLVLDNVYPEGKGHTIVFRHIVNVAFSGVVTDDDNKPVKADVAIVEKTGKVIEKVSSDEKTGAYSFRAGLIPGQVYTLSYYSDSLFFSSTRVVAKEKEKDKYVDIKTVLPKLKGGKKYVINNILFFGDSPEMLPESYPTVNALFKLMKTNKKMKIRIEGHVNDPGGGAGKDFDQSLSDNRAKTIYLVLVKRGIAKERMSTIGFSNTKMLYPEPKSEEEMQMNRRVEISVISVE